MRILPTQKQLKKHVLQLQEEHYIVNIKLLNNII
jgi:hypothetical protein